MVSTFRASCNRKALEPHPHRAGRMVPTGAPCGETFEGADGAKALAAHMKTHGPRPTFKEPAPLRPYPLHAKATAGGLERVLEKMAAGGYDVPLTAFGPKEPAGYVVEDAA